MPKTIKLRKGADIKLAGIASAEVEAAPRSSVYALKPTDFHGIVPKLLKKEGDDVKAGEPIFYSKDDQRISFASPVSGEIAEVKRGAKRKILEIRVLADKEDDFFEYPRIDEKDSRDAVLEKILNAGIWSFFKQLPFNVIADPDKLPKAIFVSGIDSAPPALDYGVVLKGKEAYFQKGLDVLGKLTDGKVYLSLRPTESFAAFSGAKGVEINYFDGPHPAGNPGVQAHHLNPVNKGEVVWFIKPDDVAILGELAAEGKVNLSRTIALAGPRIKNPKYYSCRTGARVEDLISKNGGLTEDHSRIISGDILSGSRVSMDGFLGFYDAKLTALEEGDEPQFFGWLAPNFNKFSMSRAYFNWLMPNKKLDLNTNLNGEERAYVVTGQYEEVLPMDILPVQLIKAIMTQDIEKMEQLGIYEVSEQDFALCEVVCTSKIPVQKTIREGLDLAKKELA